jgi:hypothetical protein
MEYPKRLDLPELALSGAAPCAYEQESSPPNGVEFLEAENCVLREKIAAFELFVRAWDKYEGRPGNGLFMARARLALRNVIGK